MITLCWRMATLGLLVAVQSIPVPIGIREFGHLPTTNKEFALSPYENLKYWTDKLFPDVLFTSYIADEGVHDPYLLMGRQAHRAAAYLYRKELFFGDIPHTRALLNNQELRRVNDLPDHNLSSIRINYEIPEARTIGR